MSIEIGFPLTTEQITQVIQGLTAHHPNRENMTRDEVFRDAGRDETICAMAKICNLPYIPLLINTRDEELFNSFDSVMMRRSLTVPIHRIDGLLTVAIANPFDRTGPDYCRSKFEGVDIIVVVAPLSEIEQAIGKASQRVTIDQSLVDAMSISETNTYGEFVLGDHYNDPTQEQLREIFEHAVHHACSDIHISYTRNEFFVHFRSDSEMQHKKLLQDALRPRIDALLLELVQIQREDIVKTVGVSGRFSLVLSTERRVDVRYERHQSGASNHGFHITMRLLDGGTVEPRLGSAHLSFDETTLLHLNKAINMPDGAIVFSGPTGSGKSTTLNAMLRTVHRPEYISLTLENPVEHEIPGVIHCNLKNESEFATYIKSFLRSDPDIILAGEIRDKVSAMAVVEATMTGHQVFTTIHTLTAADILDRLMFFGVARPYIAATMRLFCAQRLVKKVCSDCSSKERLTDQELKIFDLPDDLKELELVKHRDGGCSCCGGRGYKGRTAILEVLPIDSEAAAMICNNNLSSFSLEDMQRKKYGLKSLKEYGVHLLRTQQSDLDAVASVVNLTY